MSYPKDLLSTRAIVKPGLYAILPRGGLVNNVIPGCGMQGQHCGVAKARCKLCAICA